MTKTQSFCEPGELLETFGLGKFINHYPHQLSGGMQQRVSIACAMVHDPKVLLLDEPFGALDEFTRESMGEWLSKILSQNPKTVIFVTHSVEEAVLLSDRIILMTPRPGTIYSQICVDLGKPRARVLKTEAQYSEAVVQVRRILYELIENGGNS